MLIRFDLFLPGENKTSKYDNYIQAQKAGANVPELDGLESVDIINYLVDIWKELSSQRPVNGMAASPLSNSFILSNCEHPLNSLELKLVRTIDEAYLRVINGGSSNTSNKSR